MDLTKGVIFDLDGTLLNTLSDLANSVNAALREHGLPGHDREAYRRMVGNGKAMLVRRAVRAADPSRGDDEALLASVERSFSVIYREHERDETVPYPGIPEMLRELGQAGIPVGVNSNKPDGPVQDLVRHFFSDIPFAAVIGIREGIPYKPDPAGALLIAQRMGYPDGSEIAYVGDSDTDIETAGRAGMRPVGAAWGFRGEAELMRAGADAVAQDPAHLLKILLG